VGSREEHREWCSFGLAYHGGTLAADRVHDRPDVVHALLEGRRSGHAVRHAHPAFVEEDQACELPKTLAVAPELRELPADLEMRICALRVHQIDRPVSDDAKGDVDVTTACEADLAHAGSVTPIAADVNG
jgi:adenosylmethionine-8-amino-7-oxononanoate aminotransferase